MRIAIINNILYLFQSIINHLYFIFYNKNIEACQCISYIFIISLYPRNILPNIVNI